MGGDADVQATALAAALYQLIFSSRVSCRFFYKHCVNVPAQACGPHPVILQPILKN